MLATASELRHTPLLAEQHDVVTALMKACDFTYWLASLISGFQHELQHSPLPPLSGAVL